MCISRSSCFDLRTLTSIARIVVPWADWARFVVWMPPPKHHDRIPTRLLYLFEHCVMSAAQLTLRERLYVRPFDRAGYYCKLYLEQHERTFFLVVDLVYPEIAPGQRADNAG